MGTHPNFESDFDCLTEIMRRVSKLGTRLSHVRKASASSGIDTPKLFTEERGEGIVERGLNALGRKWYQKGAMFNFAQHAEHKSTWNLDHISSGNEASCTVNHQTLLHDKYCKWFTVEGMPGAGKGKFTADVAEGAGLKNMGTGHLWWEHERLREVKDQPGLYTLWKELIQSHNHYLAMRDVYMDKFFENPNDIVHSCRLQEQKLLRNAVHGLARHHGRIGHRLRPDAKRLLFARHFARRVVRVDQSARKRGRNRHRQPRIPQTPSRGVPRHVVGGHEHQGMHRFQDRPQQPISCGHG